MQYNNIFLNVFIEKMNDFNTNYVILSLLNLDCRTISNTYPTY